MQRTRTVLQCVCGRTVRSDGTSGGFNLGPGEGLDPPLDGTRITDETLVKQLTSAGRSIMLNTLQATVRPYIIPTDFKHAYKLSNRIGSDPVSTRSVSDNPFSMVFDTADQFFQ